MKLGHKSKADFQETHFGKLAEKVLGSGSITGNISHHLEQIIIGLSNVWDKADEQNNTEE